MDWVSPQIVLLHGCPKREGCHSCGQASPLVPYGLSAYSCLCPEITPQWPLASPRREWCVLVSHPSQGSPDALQGGLEPLERGCDWFKPSAQKLKHLCRVLLRNTMNPRGRCACHGANTAQHITWGEPDPSDLRSLCKSPLEGHLQGHSDCVYN